MKNRVHIDLATTSAAHQASLVARLRDLGATPADVGQGDVPWTVLADLEGNEFCVLEPRPVDLDTGPIAAVAADCSDPQAMARFWGEASAMPSAPANSGPRSETRTCGMVSGGNPLGSTPTRLTPSSAWARLCCLNGAAPEGVAQKRPVEGVHLGDQHSQDEFAEHGPVHLFAVEAGGGQHGSSGACTLGGLGAERLGDRGKGPGAEIRWGQSAGNGERLEVGHRGLAERAGGEVLLECRRVRRIESPEHPFYGPHHPGGSRFCR